MEPIKIKALNSWDQHIEANSLKAEIARLKAIAERQHMNSITMQRDMDYLGAKLGEIEEQVECLSSNMAALEFNN